MIRTATLVALILAALAVPSAPAGAAPPPIRHVFVIVLENTDYATSFGAKDPSAPYLAGELRAQGQLLTHYFGTAHESLPNYIAMVSGQGPNPITQSDCQTFQDFVGTVGADGQAMGAGCVYPAAVKTVADQLAAKGLRWGGYMEDMGNSTTDPAECRHPALNQRDNTQSARAGDQYAARHNPFVYFHSLIDTPACAAGDVPLDRLPAVLSSDHVPNLVFITPNLCHDGHDKGCVDGQPGGLVSADAFLRQWVPLIQRSAAYRQDGLLVVTFDESAGGAESCCVDDAPNTPNAGATEQGSGGGRVGALLVSPYVTPGSVNDKPYNHYSLLRSVEDLFALEPLGYAKRSAGFGDDVYNGTRCFNHALPAGGADLPRGTLIASLRHRGRRLTIGIAHASELWVRARVGRRSRRILRRHVRACTSVVATLPRGTRSAVVTATVHGRRERRALAVR